MKILGVMVREPLFHFIVAGVAIFGLQQAVQRPSDEHRIVVTRAQVQRLAENYRLQFGTMPSPLQLSSLVDKAIRGEILYREAVKLGLGEDDEIIRRRLVQKFQFLQEDRAVPIAPTESQLLDFYRRHEQNYLLPTTATFTHVYFSTDDRGEKGAREAAAAAASRFNQRKVARATEEGDSFPGPQDFSALNESEAARVFGREGVSREIFSLTPGTWSPPLRSGLGWHTVYVSSQQDARRPPFSEVRDRVTQDYLDRQRETENAQRLEQLYSQYEIVREDDAPIIRATAVNDQRGTHE